MRKLMSCVLMMTLLLSGCKAGGGGEESPENLAALIRGEYLNLTACTILSWTYPGRRMGRRCSPWWSRS